MVDAQGLKRDQNYNAKLNILEQLTNEGQIDKLKASLRGQVIKKLEQQKKKNFGGASKYLKDSLLSTTVTKKVVSNPDGLLMAEIIRDFMQFYKMEHSLHVFVPEMSLSQDFPMTKVDIERQIGVTDKDPSKPLLLKLIEKAKFAEAPPNQSLSGFSQQPAPGFSNASPEHDTRLSRPSRSGSASPDMSSPDPSSKAQNLNRQSKRQTKQAKEHRKETEQVSQKTRGLSHLGDLPNLGGGRTAAAPSNFDAFNFEEDHLGDSSNKFEEAERHLQDFEKEEAQGFSVQTGQRSFKVSIDGVNAAADEVESEIEEEIQTDRDDQNILKVGAGLTESGGYGPGGGITVSQSLGVDPSVDSLALDDYDHIEIIQQ